MNMTSNLLSRRDFLKNSTAVSAAAVLTSSSGLFAAGQEKIKLALVGCGNRGNGALKNCLEAAEFMKIQTEIVGLADYFKNRAVSTAKEHGVSEDLCFDGPLAYQKAIATDADVVLLVTPPIFRPRHFEAAVQAGKHVFMEKPVAVDPAGVRKVAEIGQTAKAKGLAVVVGTQRRHDGQFLQTHAAVQRGAIGDILSAQVYWCTKALWHRPRNPGESDADYMVRNWVSFSEMSGDHIVEQHIHNLDVAQWFLDRNPKQAMGFGGRTRRKTGNQFDFFSIDYDYGDGIHVHSMCRQINGCYTRQGETFIGPYGTTAGNGPVRSTRKNAIEVPESNVHENQMVQEHIDLLKGILDGKPENDAGRIAVVNLMAIMGRISAYTGQLVRWDDLTNPNTKSPWYSMQCKPGPEDFETGNVTAPPDDVIPVPGSEKIKEMEG